MVTITTFTGAAVNSSYLWDGVLEDYPVLRRKLKNFCVDYSLHDKPALVWQVMPTASVDVQWDDSQIPEVLRAGAGNTHNRDGWWYSFQSGRRPVPTFEGIAAYSFSDDQGWMTEVHSDGHLIGGLWSFPNYPNQDGANRPALADFYQNAFIDFAQLALSMNSVGQLGFPCLLTCTFINSDDISYVREKHPRLVASIKRKNLQWRVRTAASEAQLHSIMNLMSKELFHAFGQRLTPD